MLNVEAQRAPSPERLMPLLVLLVSLGFACTRPKEADGAARGESVATEPEGVAVAAACFRSPYSVLLGPPTPSGQQGRGPGWLALELPLQGDSGWAKLVDPGSRSFHAQWHRVAGDSVAFSARDDFLRVEVRLAVSDSVVTGSAVSHSDAALEPQPSGRVAELRREWTMRAVRVGCDSIPGGPTS